VGQAVPADDLPTAGVAVPASDLPDPAGMQTPPAKPSGGGFMIEDPRRVIGESGLAVGSSMVAPVVGGYAGIAGSLLPGEPGQGARWSERVTKALTFEPRSPTAKTWVDIASLPGRAVSYVADKVGERGAEHSPALGTIGKTSTEILPVLLGARAATKPAPQFTPKQTNAVAARDAGFKLTPEEMGAGPVARTAASLSGEPRLARSISNNNQAVVQQKVGADLGLPKGTPIDLDTLKALRAEAGKTYEQVRSAGTVAADQTYLADLAKIQQKYQTVAKDFPEVSAKTGAAEAQAIVEGLKKQAFDANSAVDLIGQLRRSADDAFRSGRSDVAQAMRGGAGAVEGMLERHLQTFPHLGDIQAFKAARERIAKTYVAEKALVGENINPQTVATQYRKGKPLTGGMKEVGQAADKFPRSLQKPSGIGTGATAHDIALALLQRAGGTLGSFGLDLLTAGARPALRAGIASRPGQFLIDPRTRIASPATQAIGAGSVPRLQEENE
jgi:hypothetical protein